MELEDFVGGIDSAVPCSQLLDLAKSLTPLIFRWVTITIFCSQKGAMGLLLPHNLDCYTLDRMDFWPLIHKTENLRDFLTKMSKCSIKPKTGCKGKLPGLVVNIKDSQSEPWSLDVSSVPGFA